MVTNAMFTENLLEFMSWMGIYVPGLLLRHQSPYSRKSRLKYRSRNGQKKRHSLFPILVIQIGGGQ
jgi:hypothetical protein